jgi:hypothetical protein
MKYTNLKFAKCLGTTLFLMTIGVFVLTSSVKAQSRADTQIQIPFDFVVKGRTFTAGKYRVERLDKANLDTLAIKNADGKTLSILQTQRINSNAPSDQSKLTFHRYGNIYFLDSIHASGESYASKLPMVKSDRKLRRLTLMAEIISVTGN